MLKLDLQFLRGDLSLQVNANFSSKPVGLLGQSGEGKTTLLHLIAGLLKPTAGRITLAGELLVDVQKNIFMPPHRRRIGMVFQDHRLFPHYTAGQNLKYGMRFLPKNKQLFDFDQIVSLLELERLLMRRPNALSGGEQQRVALGRCLLASPQLLLLDEPLASLDWQRKRQILPFFKRVISELKLPTICVSHDLEEVLELTNELAVLHGGQLLGYGAYHDLLQNKQVLTHLMPRGLTNVIKAQVRSHDLETGCTQVVCGLENKALKKLMLQTALWDVPVGETVYLGIRPQDISISLAPVAGISIRNQFSGVIDRVSEHASCMVLEVNASERIIVEVSLGSFKRMTLAVGETVTCLVKANAIRQL